jgi:hypothetical protein
VRYGHVSEAAAIPRNKGFETRDERGLIYLPSRISADAYSSRAVRNFASLSVTTCRFRHGISHLQYVAAYSSWLQRDEGRETSRSIGTHCISVNRTCHGGKPYNSKGVRLRLAGEQW